MPLSYARCDRPACWWLLRSAANVACTSLKRSCSFRAAGLRERGLLLAAPTAAAADACLALTGVVCGRLCLSWPARLLAALLLLRPLSAYLSWIRRSASR